MLLPSLQALGQGVSIAPSTVTSKKESPEPFHNKQTTKSTHRNLARKLRWARQQLQKQRKKVDAEKTFATNRTFLKFIQSQIRRYSKRKNNFDNFEKSLALSIYYSCGKIGYRQLLKLGMKLPSISTVLGWVQGFKLVPGINDNLFECIRRLMEDWPDIDKDCILAWDEMSIKEFIEYNKYTDSFEGIVDHGTERSLQSTNEVLVLMIHGIHSKWKFPLSFYFSDHATTSEKIGKIIIEHIHKLKEIGLKVRLGVCDMSFTNQGVYRDWKISPASPTKEVDGQQIVFIHDTPHLLKLVRNNLEKRDFVLEQQNNNDSMSRKRISWSYIKSFYKKDTKLSSRLAPRLSSAHVNLKDYGKMKVRLAVQVLSSSVACGMVAMNKLKLLPDASLPTANFIKTIDEIFDFLNMSRIKDVKYGKSAGHFYQNIHKIDEYIDFVRSISIPKLKQKPDFLNGLLITLSGVKVLGLKLRDEGYNILLTRYLQQDCLEHFFSNIRSKGGHCRNPTARQFRLNFRFLFFTNLMAFPANGNVEDIYERKMTNLSIAFPFDKIRLVNSTSLVTGVIAQDHNIPSPSSFYPVNLSKRSGCEKLQEEIVAVYIGAASIYAVANLKNCSTCKNILIAAGEVGSKSSSKNLLVDLKQFDHCSKGLAYLDNSVATMFSLINANFSEYAINTLKSSGTGILAGIFQECCEEKIVNEWLNEICSNHRVCILKYFIRAKIFRLLKDKNDSFVKIKAWNQSRRDLRNQ